jgi:type II secretory pathway pseudopilin PulG
MNRGGSEGAGQAGFSLVFLIGSITVMLIVMGAAVPTWRYIMKNDREEELFFRGDQIARGVERYQKKNGNALPVSLEVMVKGHYLRKIYKDPMAKDGKWRLIHPGEGLIPGGPPGRSPRPGLTPQPGATPQSGFSGPQSGFSGSSGTNRPGAGGPVQGAILGVASTSTDKSLKLMNGRSRYDQWLFLAGQPRLLGGDQGLRIPPGGIGGIPGGGSTGLSGQSPTGGFGATPSPRP